MYFSGSNRDTSLGVRLSLYRINWTLFLQSPLYGWGFGGIPGAVILPGDRRRWPRRWSNSSLSHSGGHNELMQNVISMGVLGLASRLLLLLVPLVVFTRATPHSSQRTPHRRLSRADSGHSNWRFITSEHMTSEVFNLIYTASFYGLLVAALAATALAGRGPGARVSPMSEPS